MKKIKGSIQDFAPLLIFVTRHTPSSSNVVCVPSAAWKLDETFVTRRRDSQHGVAGPVQQPLEQLGDQSGGC